MTYAFLPANLLPREQDYMGTVVSGTPNPPTVADMPDKIRPLRQFAYSIGIKRPYLYRKAALKSLIRSTLSNV